jgi:carbonic anhydrase
MKKLIRGIMEFRKTRRPMVMDTFAKLALGQSPDCLFVACSDSRVAANVFASTDPGDLFVIRNVGNIVPKHPNSGSTVAGLEYALNVLKVRHVIICGHSDCGAIRALSQNIALMPEGALRNWLRHSEDITSPKTEDLDSLSQKKRRPTNSKPTHPPHCQRTGSRRHPFPPRNLVRHPQSRRILFRK